MFLLAAAVVADGLLGPQVSPMNLAGVLPWTYWRGLGVVALLDGGQSLLHGVSLNPAARTGPPLLARPLPVAEPVALQVVRGRLACAVPVGQ